MPDNKFSDAFVRKALSRHSFQIHSMCAYHGRLVCAVVTHVPSLSHFIVHMVSHDVRAEDPCLELSGRIVRAADQVSNILYSYDDLLSRANLEIIINIWHDHKVRAGIQTPESLVFSDDTHIYSYKKHKTDQSVRGYISAGLTELLQWSDPNNPSSPGMWTNGVDHFAALSKILPSLEPFYKNVIVPILEWFTKALHAVTVYETKNRNSILEPEAPDEESYVHALLTEVRFAQDRDKILNHQMRLLKIQKIMCQKMENEWHRWHRIYAVYTIILHLRARSRKLQQEQISIENEMRQLRADMTEFGYEDTGSVSYTASS